MKNIKDISKQIYEILKTCEFDNASDSSGCFIIKKFKNGTERFVDVYKSTNGGTPHYVICCKYEDDDINYKYTNTISLQELENVLKSFYMEENYIIYNNFISVFDKIAQKLDIDFNNGFLDDDFETDYCITRPDLPECSEDEIEMCKMDWIHSIKENFLYSVIQELHPDKINDEDLEKYYEKYYDMCFDYLIDKTFENKKEITNLSITDIIEIVDYIERLSSYVYPYSVILEDMENVLNPFQSIIDEYKKSKKEM